MAPGVARRLAVPDAQPPPERPPEHPTLRSSSSKPGPKPRGILPLVIAGLAGSALGVGGTWYLVSTGMLPSPRPEATPAVAEEEPAGNDEAAEKPLLRVVRRPLMADVEAIEDEPEEDEELDEEYGPTVVMTPHQADRVRTSSLTALDAFAALRTAPTFKDRARARGEVFVNVHSAFDGSPRELKDALHALLRVVDSKDATEADWRDAEADVRRELRRFERDLAQGTALPPEP